MTVRPTYVRGLRGAGLAIGMAVSFAVAGALLGSAAASVRGNRMAPWIVGRAAGLTAYLLLVALVLVGLWLSSPSRWLAGVVRISTRIRIHVTLAALTLAFTVLHVLALATDRYAGVGWAGALLPMHAAYRPVATTLGLIGLWSGLFAGITATLAGRLPARLWWPIHKIAGISLVLVWLHAFIGGGDTYALRLVYAGTAAAVLAMSVGRYAGVDE